MVQSTSTIIVRQATLADLDIKAQIYDIVNKAYRSKGGWTTESELVGGERSTMEHIEECIKDQVNVLLLAFEQTIDGEKDKVVGTVQIQPEGTPGEAGVGLLSVDQTVQSRGIGGRLVRAAMDEMKVRGYHTAVLHVLETRAELLLWYKKLGFKETGEKEPFVWPEMLKVDSIGFLVLKKSLD